MAALEQLPPPGAPLNMDDIITGLGMGPWNYLYFAVAGLGLMTFPVNIIGAEFMAPPLNFSCVSSASNYPLDSDCFVQPADNRSITPAAVPCTTFFYDNSTYVSTLTAEFDMVCSLDRMKQLFQILFTLGCMVGSPLGGILSDMYGRQTAVFYGSLLTTVAVVVMATVPSLPVIMVARFFVGVFFMIYNNPSYTIGMEACPIKYRSTVGVTVALPYAVMVMILAGIAWLSRRWRVVQLAGSVPLFLLVILSSPCVLRKSPRWLVSHGRLVEVEADLKKAASLNNSVLNLPDDLPGTLQRIYANQTKCTDSAGTLQEGHSLGARISSLVAHPSMRRITLIIASAWLFQSALYLSIPLRSDVFESPFVYVALLGGAELPAYTVAAPITDKVGRKPFIIGCFILTALVEVTLITLLLVGQGSAWSSIVIASFGYTFICSAYQVNMMYCSELFPSAVRGLGTSIAFFMSSVGHNLPPILDTVLPKDTPWLPLLIYSCLGCVCAGLVLLLPETNRRPLMQSVQEHVNYTQENNKNVSRNTREIKKVKN